MKSTKSPIRSLLELRRLKRPQTVFCWGRRRRDVRPRDEGAANDVATDLNDLRAYNRRRGQEQAEVEDGKAEVEAVEEVGLRGGILQDVRVDPWGLEVLLDRRFLEFPEVQVHQADPFDRRVRVCPAF